MTTHDPSEPDKESVKDEDFTLPDDQKPKTGRELYEALVTNGFIGHGKTVPTLATPLGLFSD